MKITNNNNILEREIKKEENCVMDKNEIKEEIQNEKESNEIIDNGEKDYIIKIESYENSKVITYLQNRLYMNNLNGVNDYGTKFFLQ